MTAIPGPLAGIHVLDLSTFVAGPSCTLALAQLGADVVRVDPLAGPIDGGRWPLAPDASSLYWAGLNKGKRVARADLRAEDGRAAVATLLSIPGDGHGVVVTNAVGQDWLTYERLRAVRADVILVRIEGRAGGNAVDYTIQPETGLPWLTGPRELTTPVGSVLPSWDLLAGLHAAIAVLAALRQRTATGSGAEIRISLSDVAAATLANLGYLADAVVNGTERERDGNALYGSYSQDFELADGRRIMVTALTPRHWTGLVGATGTAEPMSALEQRSGAALAEEGDRYRHRATITGILSPWFAARGHAEAIAALDAAHVPWGEFRTVAQMATDPDGLVARSAVFDLVEHPGIGEYAVPRTVARSQGWGAATPPPRSAELADVHSDWAARA